VKLFTLVKLYVENNYFETKVQICGHVSDSCLEPVRKRLWQNQTWLYATILNNIHNKRA